MDEMARLVSSLVVASLVSGLVLGLVYERTNPIIQENKRQALLRTLKEVCPAGEEFAEGAGSALVSGGKEGVRSVYEARAGGRLVGYALVVEGVGFGGPMKVLVGASVADGGALVITGVKVLEHQETPGLGERVLEERFRGQFVGRRAPMASSDFQAISGATISSSKVIKLVVEATNALHEKGGEA